MIVETYPPTQTHRGDTSSPLLSNEEKRVAIYTTSDRPTSAREVTPDTPLETLNLNWTEKDLPEKVRTKHVHRLHPYLGKYIPQLAEVFLRKYFRTGQTVLDPFCGSGTTLVQANELGINAIGCDISSFNVLLSRVKSAKYDISLMRMEVLDILEKARRATQSSHNELSLWHEDMPALPHTASNYLRLWYAPNALRELLVYRKLIIDGCYTYSDLLKIILSRSARSARLTTHFDLDFPKQPQTEPYWCYKHRRQCHPTMEAFKFLRRYSLDTIRRIEEASALRTNATVNVWHVDSREADLPPLDGIITSPPYVGLIDYHDQHKYAYHLLDLEDKSSMEIGPASNGSSQKAQRQYQEDIALVFRRIGQKMPSGGRMIVVAADKANLYPEIANLAGVEVEAIIKRHVNRRTGRRSGEFFESVFIWRKP
jgi:SAM-dependent methyltransferase